MLVIPPATQSDSNLNVVHYMRTNVPFFLVTVLSMLNQYSFENMECTAENKTLVIVTYIIITLIDVVWTVLHCKHDFLINYPHTGDMWVHYAILKTSGSVLSLFSVNYFVHKGIPFNCFVDYDPVMSNTLFYLSFAIVTLIGYFEHYYWKRIEPGSSLLP